MTDTTKHVAVKVKWGKDVHALSVDPTWTMDILKAQLESLTGVPSARQKFTGLKGGPQFDDGVVLSDAGIAAGKLFMMIGTAEALKDPPPQAPTFVEDDKKKAVADAKNPCGLVNVGNSCYFNSALQVVRSVPQARAVLAARTTPLQRVLQGVFSEMDRARSETPVNPAAALMTFISQYPTFGATDDGGRLQQQDSQEALLCLLQSLQATIDANAPTTPQGLKHLFAGTHRQVVRCLDTESAPPATATLEGSAPVTDAPASVTATTPDAGALVASERVETVTFCCLPCHINEEIMTLEMGLLKAMEESFVARSDALGRDARFTKTSRLQALPEFLFVHFVRFAWRSDTKSKAKVLKPVTFPLVLDVSTLCTEELRKSLEPEREKVKSLRDAYVERRKRQRQKSGHDEPAPTPAPPGGAEGAAAAAASAAATATATATATVGNTCGYYELSGVISHKGRDADGGHYVAWVKQPAGNWLVFDDGNVGGVSEEDILRLRGVGEAHIAYVLLYRSRHPDTGDLPLPM